MELKHTQAPWAEQDWSATGPTAAADYAAIEAVKDAVKDGMPKVFTRPVVQARGVGKAVVCTAYGMSAEEVRANARMLAAAPDLLLVARDFGEALAELGLYCECGQDDCRTTRLRAAIAKATGSAE